MSLTNRKANGAHFTPPELARFVAQRLLSLIDVWESSPRILDPACGDGSLLAAFGEALPSEIRTNVTLIGVENDPRSFAPLRSRMCALDGCRTELIEGDFLQIAEREPDGRRDQTVAPVDAVIANPPYVRTQVLGSKRARALAARYQLNGRVDLYQAFLVAMTATLRPGGVLGVITSNRFLTTRSGASTRRFLRTGLELIEIVDLGDTKLFDAAVLPALIFARKRSGDSESVPTDGSVIDGPSSHVSSSATTASVRPSSACRFLRAYEAGPQENESVSAMTLWEGLRDSRAGLYGANGAVYRMTAGVLPLPEEDARPWTMLTRSEMEWLRRVEDSAACRLGEAAQVRVGIKTTADPVFIREDWDALPEAIRPEERHLFPLLSRDDAGRWRSGKPRKGRKRILYTHEVVDGRRRVIRFDATSPTWAYLLEHRSRLESRRYVLEAGREWYEIWVPQDPAAWRLPKIVFPDISPDARFFLDPKGGLVDGNCYWITTRDAADEDLLLLILGTANSSLMMRYHDLAFQNRLYSQRRRHLTQYVSQYPLPDRDGPAASEIIETVRRLVSSSVSDAERQSLEAELDRLVALAFGFATIC
jgi:adenine-specific DNA-methyltransferase